MYTNIRLGQDMRNIYQSTHQWVERFFCWMVILTGVNDRSEPYWTSQKPPWPKTEVIISDGCHCPLANCWISFPIQRPVPLLLPRIFLSPKGYAFDNLRGFHAWGLAFAAIKAIQFGVSFRCSNSSADANIRSQQISSQSFATFDGFLVLWSTGIIPSRTAGCSKLAIWTLESAFTLNLNLGISEGAWFSKKPLNIYRTWFYPTKHLASKLVAKRPTKTGFAICFTLEFAMFPCAHPAEWLAKVLNVGCQRVKQRVSNSGNQKKEP